MDELISRQAVMDCFRKWQPYMATRLWDYEQELKDLPSAIPQPKTEWVTKWIPVSERLPEIGQRILVTYNQEDEVKIDITYYTKRGFLLSVVIAWMPLPTPYKKNEVEEHETLRG